VLPSSGACRAGRGSRHAELGLCARARGGRNERERVERLGERGFGGKAWRCARASAGEERAKRVARERIFLVLDGRGAAYVNVNLGEKDERSEVELMVLNWLIRAVDSFVQLIRGVQSVLRKESS
jgi:hypothetical protein